MKALSRKEILGENEYLKEKIKWLERNMFWYKIGVMLATWVSLYLLIN